MDEPTTYPGVLYAVIWGVALFGLTAAYAIGEWLTNRWLDSHATRRGTPSPCSGTGHTATEDSATAGTPANPSAHPAHHPATQEPTEGPAGTGAAPEEQHEEQEGHGVHRGLNGGLERPRGVVRDAGPRSCGREGEVRGHDVTSAYGGARELSGDVSRPAFWDGTAWCGEDDDDGMKP